MKKTLSALLPCAALALASCGDGTNEVHQTFFMPQMPGGMTLYADQQQDTIHLLSIDSWTLSADDSWLSVSPTTGIVPVNGSLDQKLTLTATTNSTSEPRRTAIRVQAHDWVSMAVTQTSWLNITRPSAVYQTSSGTLTTKATNSTPAKAYFPMNVKQEAHDTTIVFTTYQDNATLTTNVEWAQPAETIFSAGKHTVTVSIAANEAAEKRQGLLTLTSDGVSTDINLTQSGTN